MTVEKFAELVLYNDAKPWKPELLIRTSGRDRYFDEALTELVRVRYPWILRARLERFDDGVAEAVISLT